MLHIKEEQYFCLAQYSVSMCIFQNLMIVPAYCTDFPVSFFTLFIEIMLMIVNIHIIHEPFAHPFSPLI